MHTSMIFLGISLYSLTTASPVPADVNVPITSAEWTNLGDGGLTRRDAQATVDQPITDAEWTALQDGGLSRRDESAPSSLIARDSTITCGHLVTGKGGSGGHGKWNPVAEFSQMADRFCKRLSPPPIRLSYRLIEC